MMMPMSPEILSGKVRWPVFLLANKVLYQSIKYSIFLFLHVAHNLLLFLCSQQLSTALSISKDFVGKDQNLFRRMKKDENMYYAVQECFESLKYILEILVVGDWEKRYRQQREIIFARHFLISKQSSIFLLTFHQLQDSVQHTDGS